MLNMTGFLDPALKCIDKLRLRQQTNYLAHLVRQSNTTLTKRLLFNENKYCKRGRRTETLCDKVLKITGTNRDQFCKAALKREIGHGHPIGSGRRKLSK